MSEYMTALKQSMVISVRNAKYTRKKVSTASAGRSMSQNRKEQF